MLVGKCYFHSSCSENIALHERGDLLGYVQHSFDWASYCLSYKISNAEIIFGFHHTKSTINSTVQQLVRASSKNRHLCLAILKRCIENFDSLKKPVNRTDFEDFKQILVFFWSLEARHTQILKHSPQTNRRCI